MLHSGLVKRLACDSLRTAAVPPVGTGPIFVAHFPKTAAQNSGMCMGNHYLGYLP